MLLLEPGLVGRAPDRIVANDVDAAPELAVLAERVSRGRLGESRSAGEQKNSDEIKGWVHDLFMGAEVARRLRSVSDRLATSATTNSHSKRRFLYAPISGASGLTSGPKYRSTTSGSVSLVFSKVTPD